MSRNPLLQVKFDGVNLKGSAVPIYDLGVTLVAVQRMVNKALRTQLGDKLTEAERKKYALQIHGHGKGSDWYDFIAFLEDPTVVDVLKDLLGMVLYAAGGYVLGKLGGKPEIHSDGPQNIQAVFQVNIFNEMKQISERVKFDQIIESVELIPGFETNASPVKITEETRRNILHIENEAIQGPREIVRGTIAKLFPNRNQIEFRKQEGTYCKIELIPSDFERLRYQSKKGDIISLEVFAVFKYGIYYDNPEYYQCEQILSIEPSANGF